MTNPSAPSAPSQVISVVPCLNERDHLEALVERILDDPDWISPLLVIADGGSTDGTVELASRLAARDDRIRLVHNPKRVQSAAVNLAVHAFGQGRRWLVRVDAHAEYPPRFVSTLVREAEWTGAQSVVVSMQTRGRGWFQSAVALAQNSRLGNGGSPHRVASAPGFVDTGHHALFDLEAFVAAGGYDETFTHNEDAEFDVRLRRRGGRIWLTCETSIIYFPRSSPGPLYRQYVAYGRGRLRTLLRHRVRPHIRQVLPIGVAPALAALTVSPLWPEAAAPALSWAGLCLGYGAAIAFAQRTPSGLLAGPAAMIMHTGWSIGFWTQLANACCRLPSTVAEPSPGSLAE